MEVVADYHGLSGVIKLSIYSAFAYERFGMTHSQNSNFQKKEIEESKTLYQQASETIDLFLKDKKVIESIVDGKIVITLEWSGKRVPLCEFEGEQIPNTIMAAIPQIIRFNQFQSLVNSNELPKFIDYLEFSGPLTNRPIFNCLKKLSTEEIERLNKLESFFLNDKATGFPAPIDEIHDFILLIVRIQLLDDSQTIMDECRQKVLETLDRVRAKDSRELKFGEPIMFELYGKRYRAKGDSLVALIKCLSENEATTPTRPMKNADIKTYFEKNELKKVELYEIMRDTSNDIVLVSTGEGKSSLTNIIFNKPFNDKDGVFLNQFFRIIK